MANGKIKADTLEHSTAGSLGTKFVVNGSAKSTLHYDHQAPAIRASFNVSSVTDDATGNLQINYTSSFSNIYYSVYGSFSMNYGSSSALGYSAHADGSSERAPQTANCFMESSTLNGSAFDSKYNMLATDGDLA
tara:strand:+ start:438 stop:839 length:402 start_codon:yes stop_codon:yes gene_type:complete